MKKIYIKYGLAILLSFSLLGCSQKSGDESDTRREDENVEEVNESVEIKEKEKKEIVLDILGNYYGFVIDNASYKDNVNSVDIFEPESKEYMVFIDAFHKNLDSHEPTSVKNTATYGITEGLGREYYGLYTEDGLKEEKAYEDSFEGYNILFVQYSLMSSVDTSFAKGVGTYFFLDDKEYAYVFVSSETMSYDDLTKIAKEYIKNIHKGKETSSTLN